MGRWGDGAMGRRGGGAHLSEAGARHGDDGRELHLEVDVAARALAHAVLRHAVVRAAVLLVHRVQLQDVAPATDGHITYILYHSRYVV